MNTAAEPEEDAEMKTIPGSITKNENQGEGGGGMLCLPDNQVAGHRAEGGILGPLVDKSGRFYKPLQDNQRGENEVTFYQKFWSDQRVPPRVQHFFPRFYDTAFVQASDGAMRAPLISGQRLQKYVYHKISNEIPQGPYCVVYIHTSAQRGENCPGVSTLRLIYEELPPTFKKRLELVYFLHPGIQSRLLFATFGRFFLSAGKGQIEIPDFVYDHDDRLEDRPLMDYGIKTNPFQVYDMPAMGSADSRYSLRWTSPSNVAVVGGLCEETLCEELVLAVTAEKIVVVKRPPYRGRIPLADHAVIEDLTYQFQHPSIIDIKMGSRTWYPGASEEYIKKCLSKDRETSSLLLGFRISGMQVYESSERAIWKADKNWCKRLTNKGVRVALKRFVSLNPSSETEPDGLLAPHIYGAPGCILSQLLELKAWFEEQTLYHFYSASILLIYEGDSTSSNESFRSSGFWKRGISVKLIDYAHVLDGENIIDHNFLGGLCSLINVIAQIVAGRV